MKHTNKKLKKMQKGGSDQDATKIKRSVPLKFESSGDGTAKCKSETGRGCVPSKGPSFNPNKSSGLTKGRLVKRKPTKEEKREMLVPGSGTYGNPRFLEYGGVFKKGGSVKKKK